MKPRSSLAFRLTDTFLLDRDTKACCLTSCAEKIQHNTINRMFDDFPDIFDVSLSSEQLKNIFKDVKRISLYSKHDAPLVELSHSTELKLQLWVKTIIKKACVELLNNDGELEAELLDLLQIKNFSAMLNSNKEQVICAFVGWMTQAIMKNESFLELVRQGNQEANMRAFTAICNYVNLNYGAWVIDELHHPVNATQNKTALANCTFREILELPVKKPYVAVGILATVGTLFCAGLTLYGIFSNASSKDNSHGHTSKNNFRH